MGWGGWRAPVWSLCVNTLLAALGAQAQVLAGLSGGRRGPATRPAPGSRGAASGSPRPPQSLVFTPAARCVSTLARFPFLKSAGYELRE